MLYGAGARQTFGKFKVPQRDRAAARRQEAPGRRMGIHRRHAAQFLVDKVRPSARAAIPPNAPRVAGDHCQWCKGGSRCRTRKDRCGPSRRWSSPIEDPDPTPVGRRTPRSGREHPDSLKGNCIKSIEEHACASGAGQSRALPG